MRTPVAAASDGTSSRRSGPIPACAYASASPATSGVPSSGSTTFVSATRRFIAITPASASAPVEAKTTSVLAVSAASAAHSAEPVEANGMRGSATTAPASVPCSERAAV